MPKKGKRQYYFGIDLGGTKLLTTLYDSSFKLVASTKKRTSIERGEKFLMESIESSIQQVLNDAELERKLITAIGFGVPGVVDFKRHQITLCPNIHFLENSNFVRKIEKKFRAKVAIENDVNAGLYGEFCFGAAKTYSHVVGVFPGTGIGGALILEGRLYRGASGAAGEIGHILMDPLGPRCGCGKHGCLEALVSRVGIASEAVSLALRQKAKKLYKLYGTDIADIKSNVLRKSIEAGDQAIRELVEFRAGILGIALSHVVNILNPELIVLGGGLVEALPNLVIKESTRQMKRYALPSVSKDVQIVAAKLKDFAVAMGAAKLASES